MKEVKVIVRKERVDALVHALRGGGVTRLWTSHVHALGVGVDPEKAHLSMEEGAEFMEKAKVELFCRSEDLEEVIRIVREHAATGHRGDGLIAVTPLERLVSVRTGDEELLAVL